MPIRPRKILGAREGGALAAPVRLPDHVVPASTAFVVELPPGPLSGAAAARLARAVEALVGVEAGRARTERSAPRGHPCAAS